MSSSNKKTGQIRGRTTRLQSPSLSAFVEGVALFLRTSLKKERTLHSYRVAHREDKLSAVNTIEQIAVLLRTQVHNVQKRTEKNKHQ